ncbi:MAG TPA: ECF-type sigma factor [Pirellulaceae bacterium]|nr:ECF-type sigma factor [Pirellulaceae bacterium]HMO93639.1 ECF-type sigma factor [Pirellulaceae bacterium]HMP71399.1 ECF-type sigma factor [Pirellulaceae bacterium]
MKEHGSVSEWIEQLKTGEQGDAQQKLWNRYFQQLVVLARSKLAGVPRGMEDEEDAVISALNSFFQRVPQGQFPLLLDRTDLWSLLVKLTCCKAINQRRRAQAKKRGGATTNRQTSFSLFDDWLAHIADRRITAELAVETAEELRRLLDLLDKESLRSVAQLKLEGFTNREIAATLGVIERTVERRLVLLRELWIGAFES